MNKISTPGISAASVTGHRMNSSTFQTRYVKYFFVAMACLFPILVLLGFVPDYVVIFGGQLKVHWFSHLHGVIMSAWLAMFFTQSFLAAKGNLRLHRQLGMISFGLGILVWLTMIIVTFRALIANNPPMEDSQFDVLLIALNQVVLFGLFFTWGMLVRKKDTTAHKRLLLLATIVILQAAIDRIRFLPGINTFIFIRFLYLDLLLVPLLIYDYFTLKRIHQITWIGAICIGLVQAGNVIGVESRAWHQFWFNAISPFVEKVVEVQLTDKQAALLVGDYGDKNWHMTISQESGKLYLQLPTLPKRELGATSSTRLFVRTINWKLNFIIGTDGQVTKIINDQIAIEWEAKRIKQP
ncbi:hypothetical protein GXP67_35885 [Rhodocytophaga rosea]|uniref:DUF2306 domain-containing protein n=1 Tax=Rhodocytophaga rosea TaxID=2704465 RepID=A0A6C0GU02_9BACT|nr:hypothetical protein [Rhodocytophaga rosea]QHT71671.1 hypothetical protein GXP67_35885 [Rhodocytophaga rosea]